MITVTVAGLDKLRASLSAMAKNQLPYALARAIHMTAHDARKATIAEMRIAFDRPTPMTLRSMFVRPSRPDKAKPEAMVFLKDTQISATGTAIRGYAPSVPEYGSMARIIGHQFSGGTRERKALEKALERGGYISATEFIVPGPDAPLDPATGNMTRGFSQQVMTALRVQRDVYANPTQSRRSRRNAKKAGNLFWSNGGNAKGRLRRGLWGSRDGKLLLMLVVVPKVSYRQRIDLQAIAQKTMRERFDANFDQALKFALRTARP